ncbi:hypothetical protein QBC44DRAFT_9416 [Cladorrhinum sp. PSN332]|nr:hypothetical protein QBC44DRAFT_9416 [Cladorrhinum sp. PSN332]
MENHQYELGPLWDEQSIDDLLATTNFASCEVIDDSQHTLPLFPDEPDTLWSPAFLDSELGFFIPDVTSPDPCGDMGPQLQQDSSTPGADFVTPASLPTNFNWTPSPGDEVAVTSSSSISSDPSCLSPDQTFLPRATFALGELQNFMLLDQNLQTGPIQAGVTPIPETVTDVQDLSKDAGGINARCRQRRRLTISARERCKQERPVKCPICNKGFPYVTDMNKHVVVHHREQAPGLGISTDRPACHICDKTFARKDHLARHRQRAHGAAKTIRGRARKK